MKKSAPSRKKTCAFIRSHLISVIEENAAGTSAPYIREHLVSCLECASLVKQFAQGWDSPATPENIQPRQSFFPDLIRRIEADENLGSGAKTFRAFAWRILRPAAVAALFLGGILAGYEMGKKEKPLAPPEESIADRFVASFENIPKGSVADFYINRQNSKKVDPK